MALRKFFELNFFPLNIIWIPQINLTTTIYSTYHSISAITTKFVTDHKLTNEISLEELSQYASEILELLTTGVSKVDKEKRHQARDHLQKGYKYNKEQAFILIPYERVGWSKSQVILKEEGSKAKEVNIYQVSDSTYSEEIIKETAQCIV